MWTEYTKIDTIAKRDLEGNKRLIDGTFRDPAIEYLQDVKFEATEKADGTNVSVHWNGHRVSIHGRTEAAQLPKALTDMLYARFMDEQTEQVFEQLFPTKHFYSDSGEQVASDVVTEATIYGEGIGPKIQKVGKLYGNQYRFLVFDIKVGGVYLEHSNPFYAQIVKAFGVEEVPALPDMTPNEAIEFVKSKPRSWINSDAPMEGVVLRPKVRLYGPNGSRLIAKVKTKDYEPYNQYAEEYGWVKKGKCVVYDEQFPDGRTVGHRLHRCTVSKIFSESGKVESRDTCIELREIDTGMVVPCASAEDVYRYDKASWNLSASGAGRPDDSCAEKLGDAEG